MGRIRTKRVKRVGQELLDLHKGVFTDKFLDNKKLVDEKAVVPTKKLRNLIAGYITKKVKTTVD